MPFENKGLTVILTNAEGKELDRREAVNGVEAIKAALLMLARVPSLAEGYELRVTAPH